LSILEVLAGLNKRAVCENALRSESGALEGRFVAGQYQLSPQSQESSQPAVSLMTAEIE
jgi:hypothetical protein